MAAAGILVVNKPIGRTSRWVTNLVSRMLQEKKAGHLGTLDPIATGVLPIILGKATRLIRFLEADSKVYRAVLRLGRATDTQDRTGQTTFEGDPSGLGRERIAAEAAAFSGEIVQVPPMHSALKKDGQPLYRLARAGIEVEREPRRVTVFELEIEAFETPDLTLRVRCSPGTYLRSIAHDLGQALGCGAHLHSLVRLSNGPFTIDQAVDLDGLEAPDALRALIPPAQCLPHFPALDITDGQLSLIRDGVAILAPGPEADFPAGRLHRLLHNAGLAAVAEAQPHGETVLLKPCRVFI